MSLGFGLSHVLESDPWLIFSVCIVPSVRRVLLFRTLANRDCPAVPGCRGFEDLSDEELQGMLMLLIFIRSAHEHQEFHEALVPGGHRMRSASATRGLGKTSPGSIGPSLAVETTRMTVHRLCPELKKRHALSSARLITYSQPCADEETWTYGSQLQ